MKYALHDFRIEESGGKAHVKFTVEKSGKRIEYDEMLRYENEDDVSFLKAIDDFIRKKVK